MHSKSGFSLIELLIIVTILAIVAAIAIPFGSNFLNAHRAKSAFQEFYGDLQEARMNSFSKRNATKGPGGFGLLMTDEKTYITFEFQDENENAICDPDPSVASPNSEMLDPVEHNLPEGVAISISGTPFSSWSDAQKLVLFNRHGLKIGADGSAVANVTYVVSPTGGGTSKCVSMSPIRMREGVWNGSSCN